MSGIFGLIPLDGETSLGTDCTVWADARIDYRKELCQALNVPCTSLDDAGLTLAAYQHWGEDCVKHLRGDFAFAIWDPREQKLFCARDHFGMRPFYYHHAAGKRFVFASDARAIFGVNEVPYALNEGRIADFIVPELEWIDLTSTFFDGVYRLPPAHALVVTPSSFGITEYWSPDPGPGLAFTTDEAFCEGFIEVFSRAIEERRRGNEPRVGATLSGGMDSGSIVAITSPLPTYSLAKSRSTRCEESQRIYATLDQLGLKGTQIIVDQPDSLIDGLGRDLAEPYDGEFLFLKAIYEAASGDGIDVVLDGAAGDVVLNEGDYIGRLLRRGRFWTAWRETAGNQAFWGQQSVLPAFLRQVRNAFAPEFIKQVVRPGTQVKAAQQFVETSLIDAEFARHVEIETRFERMRETFAGTRAAGTALERVSKIRPNLTAGRERYARIAASAGVTATDPFLDLHVVQFCAQLPDRLLARNGWPKYLLRIAMEGRLPDTVRWGRGKPHIGRFYNQLFLGRERSSGRLSLRGLQDVLRGYIDPAKLQLAWQRFETVGDFESIHSAYVLSLWLEQSVMRPVVNDKGFS